MNKKNILLLTPGPTSISRGVLSELSKERLNPDLDLNFYDEYLKIGYKLQKLTNTTLDFLILAGEGMLGLDASLCSMIEPNDKVLCLDNGIFGKGFEDLAKLYCNNVTRWGFDYHKGIDCDLLEKKLINNHDFTIATLVHVDTPTGVVNDITKIAEILKKYNIYVIVDAVSGIGGDKIDLKDNNVDILLGASQKVISSPVGLTVVGLSKNAWLKMENRKVKINSFYNNLLLFKNWYQKKWFPYTMPSELIYAFSKGIDELNEVNYYNRIALDVRERLKKMNIELYLEDNYSNSVTAFFPPNNLNSVEFIKIMLEEYNIMISTSLSQFQNKLVRIGHMGNNAKIESINSFFSALEQIIANKVNL